MMRKLTYWIFGLLIFLIGAFAAFKYTMRPPAHTDCLPAMGKTATVFLIDGLENERFRALLSQGKLPFIKSMIDGGVYVENGISSFPTMTGFGYYPLITGVDAVNSGILGLRWFDRNRTTGNLRNYVGRTNVWMNKDIDSTSQNAFELSRDTFTASINSFMNKGVKEAVITGWYHSGAKFEGMSVFPYLRNIPFIGHEIAMNHFEHEENAMKIAIDQLQCNPKFHFITLPSPDATNHVHGFTDQYEKLLVYIDALMATYWEEVKRLGQADQRLLVLASDHGVEAVTKNLDLRENFQQIGLNMERGNAVNIKSIELNEPISNLENLDAYFVINGNLSAYIYFKGTENWGKALSASEIEQYPTQENRKINIAQYVANQEGINWVAYNKGPQEATIYDDSGYAQITVKDSFLKYEVITSDVFEYRDSTLLGEWMTKSEWLENTQNTNFPYAVPRLYDLLKAKGMGDLVLTSKPGYDLGKAYEKVVGNYKGGHGALRRQLLVVPFIFYSQNLSSQSYKSALSEDVGATILDWMGFKDDQRAGKILF